MEIKEQGCAINQHRGAIDENQQATLRDKIKEISSEIESMLDFIPGDKKLSWEITWVAPLSEKQVEEHRARAEEKSEEQTWYYIGSGSWERGKKFGHDFGKHFERLSPSKQFIKLKPYVLKDLLANPTWDCHLITVWDFFLHLHAEVDFYYDGKERGYYHDIQMFLQDGRVRFVDKWRGEIRYSELLGIILFQLLRKR
jgi:hypothetical protein